VVGDDAQSIYAFRAATVRNILDFPDQFSPRAAVISLEHNYRSTQPILDAANAVISQAREGFSKTLTSSKPSAELPHLVSVEDEEAQAVYVADQVWSTARRELIYATRPSCFAPHTIAPGWKSSWQGATSRLSNMAG
jgi:DNA helicase II / ATP-dependent DNA helicase PcrA